MAEEQAPPEKAPPSTPGAYQGYKSGDYEIESNRESSQDMEENLTSEPENKDAPKKDPEEEAKENASKAASELGKRGAAARAEKPAEPAKPVSEDKQESKGESKGEGDEKADPKEGKPRQDPNARVRQVTREAAELKRELAAERAERARLEAELRAPKGNGKPDLAPDPGDPEPVYDDEKYADYRDFTRDEARWAARQELRAERTAAAERASTVSTRQQQEHMDQVIGEKVAAFNAKMRQAQEQDPAFAAAVEELTRTLQPSFTLARGERPTALNALADEIVDSGDGPRLLRHFAQQPDELERFAAMRPRELVQEVALLKSSLGAAPAPAPAPKATPSKAQPPITPVSGSPTKGDPYELTDDLSDDDWMARRMALAKKDRRA